MKQIYLSFASAALLLTASCTGGIPPEDDCLETASRTRTVTVSLTVDSTFTQLCDAVYPSRSRTDGRLLRYKIWATDLTGRIVASAVTHEPEAVLTLPAGRCNVSAWADDVLPDVRTSSLFFTDDPAIIQLKDKDGYRGTWDKAGWFGTVAIPSVAGTTRVELPLSSPQARYRIVATDTADYTVDKVVIGYPGGVWSGVNIFTGLPCLRWGGTAFRTIPPAPGQPGELACDLPFVAPSETLPVRVSVYDTSGRRRGYVSRIDVPLGRGRLTTVKGRFYHIDETPPDTTTAPHGGGIGIDPGFDNTIDITIDKQ